MQIYINSFIIKEKKRKIIIRNELNFQFKEGRLIGSLTIAFQQA